MNKEITVNDLGKRARLIAEFYFSHPNMSRKDIAKELGISQQRVSQVLTHPKVRAVYRVLARGRQSDLLSKAVKAQEECLDQSQNLQVKLKAAEDILKSEKVLDNPITPIAVDIRISDVRVLQEKVQKAASQQIGDIIEGEIVADSSSSAVQDTTQPEA